MNVIRSARERRGYSQRELAKRAGVSFRCVQQLERPGHNWSVSSLKRVARALAVPAGGLRYHLDYPFRIPPDSIEDISLRIHGEEFSSWKLHVFNFVDRFRATRDPDLIARPPMPELDPRLHALLAGVVETLCAEIDRSAPSWCAGIDTLPEPWFVAGIENLKPAALVESPVRFRTRNIFVLGNFLERA
ncbi:MAG: helix-turn-helix transcriptional regulator [bacterium]